MAKPAFSFLFGGNTRETPESIKRKRDLAMAIMGASSAPRNVGEGLNALGSGIAAGIMNRRADKAETEGRAEADALFNRELQGQFAGRLMGQAPDAGALSRLPPDVKPSAGTASAADADMSGNDVYSSFMDKVDDKITNPFGLAAVAATGKEESDFLPEKVNRTWSDPSESGKAGTAGGIMSWRENRLAKLQAHAASKGEQGNGSPQTQAEFFLGEDPNLIIALNNAKNIEEAQEIINRAWKFSGWNRPAGEAAERLATARAFLPNFQGRQAPQPVAGTFGRPSAHPQQIATVPAPTGKPSLADEVAAFEQTPEYRAQFPGMNDPQAGPPAQNAPQGIPLQFQGSRQLANAQGGIMPALMGGTPATPEQIERAQAMGQQAQRGPDQMSLLRALGSPFLSEEQRAVLRMLYQQQVQERQAAREQ